MTDAFSYKQYVTDQTFTEKYQAYQKRYSTEPRESDKVIIELVRNLSSASLRPGNPVRLLDIGCSTGNLLYHLKRNIAGIEFVGADMVPSILDECRRNADLNGIRFEERNVLDLGYTGAFDIITVNAVLYMLDDGQFRQSIVSIEKALRPGGRLFVFDFFHEFNQDLAILEKSKSHPDGLMLHFRPRSTTKRILEDHGFSGIRFLPFSIPIDLALGKKFSDDEDGFEDLNSHTIKDESGARMLFRGTLYQPWCHLVAQKAS
jgi:SAM-dependent methyltransferase